MKLKSIAIKGLIGLVVVVALCMFFSETIKSITTPKVQFINASTGRFEDKIILESKVYFEKENEEEFVIEDARKIEGEGIVVEKIYVSPGFEIKEGEIIFTAYMPGYDKTLEKMEQDYIAKAREILDLEVANKSASIASQQNELHQGVIEKQGIYSESLFEAKAMALKENIKLTQNTGDWKTIVVTSGGSSDLKEKVDKAIASKAIYEETYKEFMDSFNNKAIKLTDEVFTYIAKRNSLEQELNDLMEERLKFFEQNLAIQVVKAPYDGYLLELNVEVGKPYDGNSVAFKMNKKDQKPLMRAEVQEKDKKKVLEGGKVAFTVEGGYGSSTVNSTITKVESNIREGKRYAYIDLTEELVENLGPLSKLLREEEVQGTLTYRAKTSSTILPASAVRDDSDGSYIYTVDHVQGNILQGNMWKAVKTKVTVIERSDSKVSIQEEFWGQVADREDRPISDGDTVMEYNQQ